jgi:hypothetical protein
VRLGGWRPVRDEDGTLRKDLSPWFAMELDEQSAPWVYWRGLPFKVIGALELLASLVALLLFGPERSCPPDSSAW